MTDLADLTRSTLQDLVNKRLRARRISVAAVSSLTLIAALMALYIANQVSRVEDRSHELTIEANQAKATTRSLKAQHEELVAQKELLAARVQELNTSIVDANEAFNDGEIVRGQSIVAREAMTALEGVDPLELVASGKKALEDGRWEDALMLFQQAKNLALTTRLPYAEPFYMLAEMAFRSDRWEDAKIRYRQALQREPLHELAAFGLARLLMLEGDFAAADAFSAKVEAVNPAVARQRTRIRELLALNITCVRGKYESCMSIGESLYYSHGPSVNAGGAYLKAACSGGIQRACKYLDELRRRHPTFE